MNKLKEQATELRDAGYSYAMIQNELGISKSTLSNWFSSRPFTPNKEFLRRSQVGPMKVGLQRHNDKLARLEKIRVNAKEEIGIVTERDLQMFGLGLYAGEGAKTTQTTRIINADPQVIRTTIYWLRIVHNIEAKDLCISMHLYPDNDEELSKQYWHKITNIPLGNFRTTQVDRRQKKGSLRKNRLPYGTAHVRVLANGDRTKGVDLHNMILSQILSVYEAIDPLYN